MDRLAVLGGKPVRMASYPAWPQSDGRDLKYLQEVLETSQWGGTIHGPKVTAFCETWARFTGSDFAVGMTSCTAGMELALRAFGIGPGDEVIVPSYTFIATAVAPLTTGADVVMVDIDPRTFCITPGTVAPAITSRTKAIIPVHFAGLAADVEGLLELARRHDLKIVWDCAHAHTTEWRGKMVGGLPQVSSYSFNHAKNLTCGEGGMVTTDDPELADLLRYTLSTFGRKKGRPWYEHHHLGFAHPLIEFQAAILMGQFERLEAQSRLREENARALTRGLSEIEGFDPPTQTPDTTRHGWHIYMATYHPEAFEGLPKADFLRAMNAEGIPCTGGYIAPLQGNPMFDRATGRVKGGHSRFREMPCPNAEWACREGAILFSQSVLLSGPDDMNDIVAAVAKVKAGAKDLADLRVGQEAPDQVSGGLTR